MACALQPPRGLCACRGRLMSLEGSLTCTTRTLHDKHCQCCPPWHEYRKSIESMEQLNRSNRLHTQNRSIHSMIQDVYIQHYIYTQKILTSGREGEIVVFTFKLHTLCSVYVASRSSCPPGSSNAYSSAFVEDSAK